MARANKVKISIIIIIIILLFITIKYKAMEYIHIYEDIRAYPIGEIVLYKYEITREYKEDGELLTDFKEIKGDEIYTMLGHYKGDRFYRLSWQDVAILEMYFNNGGF